MAFTRFLRFSSWRGLSPQRGGRSLQQEHGFVMPATVVLVIILGIGIVVVASRAANNLLGSVRQVDSRKVREAAEFGLNAIVAQLNTNENSYLLATKFGNWQTVASNDLSRCNLRQPTAAPAANRITGVSTNATNTTVALANDLAGTTTTYSLINYIPPQPPVVPGSGCSSAADPFGNLFGGRGQFTVRAIVTRNGAEQARYDLVRAAHIRGGIPGGGANPGDTVLVVTGPPSGSSFDSTDFIYDFDGDGRVDAFPSVDKPVDVACLSCSTAASQSSLQNELGLSNSGTIGDIIAGPITLPPVPAIPSELSGVTPVDITTETLNYPYTTAGPPNLRPECRSMTVNDISGAQIGCRVNNLSLTNGSDTMVVNTTFKPVNIYFAGNINVSGSRNLSNGTTDADRANNWSRLRLFGVSGTPNSTGSNCTQEINLSGANSISGAFGWFPLGVNNNNGGGGNLANYFGVLWACKFDGSGSNIFMAPFNASDAISGIITGLIPNPSPVPLQPFVFRAYGVN